MNLYLERLTLRAVLTLVLVLGLGVALVGSILPVRRALSVEPVELLRGR